MFPSLPKPWEALDKHCNYSRPSDIPKNANFGSVCMVRRELGLETDQNSSEQVT